MSLSRPPAMRHPFAILRPAARRMAYLLSAACAFLLASCLSSSDRIAGSSTEAGNAGGKLSLADGRPAAGVAVSLIAKDFLPDTLGRGGSADVAGSYYRTLTGPDGRFHFSQVAPGDYRVMAIDAAQGATVDSVAVGPGHDTLILDGAMKQLGGISGVAKIIGLPPASSVNIWVSPKSTLKMPPRADANGVFNLDSLPEGEYELVPQCFSCQPVTHGVKVLVKAGAITMMSDTLKLYPEYFFGFPDSGDLILRTAWLPVPIGGKINRGAEDRKNPASVTWTWNGGRISGKDRSTPDGISETAVMVDSGWFPATDSGRLRLVLHYPDTAIMREWRVVLDPTERIWPLSAVAARGAVRIPGPVNRSLWRVHVTASQPLDSGTAAFWGLWPGVPANASVIPEWLDLGADEGEMLSLEGADTAAFTFFLIPDREMGGRIFRIRRDERLADIGEIRYLERASFGFPDSLEPSMLPGGLIVDRRRGTHFLQRYRVDAAGTVTELIGRLTHVSGFSDAPTVIENPLCFYRKGPAQAGYAWNEPLRGAAKALAVTHEGLAFRLDGAHAAVRLSNDELDSLKAILSPLTAQPAVVADTMRVETQGTLHYLLAGGRGVMGFAGDQAAVGGMLARIDAWMLRNGLEEAIRFPLARGSWSWLGFRADSAGLVYTGDTLRLELRDSGNGIAVSEYLSEGSPGRPTDATTLRYFLGINGDSLVAWASESVNSGIFGRIDELRGIFALTGLETVTAGSIYGIPQLIGGGNTLSGFLDGEVEILGRTLPHPAVFLDGRPILDGRQGRGFLYAPERGLERAWRFGAAPGTLQGWDRE
jgi:hypothetical protein